MEAVNVKALKTLKANRANLTRQQYRTLYGQVLSGNAEGALKGLATIIKRGGSKM